MDVQCINTIDCKQGAVRAVRFNIDGSYCLTCGSDKKLKLWNPYRSLLLKTYGGHGNEVLDAAGSCDSSQIVSCSSDKSVILWDVSTGQPLRRLRGHGSTVTCVKFNEESTVAVSGSLDNTVMCWDLKSRKQDPIQVLNDAKDCISSVQVTDHEILTGSVDCSVRRYDLRNGSCQADFVGAPVTSVSFSNDGQCILVGSADSTVRLLDKNTGEMLGEYSGHRTDDMTIDTAINRKDDHVLSGSVSGELWCWDLVSGQLVKKFMHTPKKVLNSLSVHPRKEIVLTASVTTVKVWGQPEDLQTSVGTNYGILTAVNCFSVRWAMRIQNVFTMAKLFALFAIILVGVYHIARGRVENFENSFEGSYEPTEVALAFYSGLFAFGGWNFLNFVTEELKDPYTNLPRAIWIALPVVTAVYVLANVAYFALLDHDELLSSTAVAVSFGNKTFGPLAWLVPVFVALSCFGGVNGILFTSARLFLIGSQEGHLPDVFSFIHVRRMTPIPSLLITCITSLLMLFISNVFVLINYFSQVLWLSVAASVCGLLWLRYKEPNMPRPIKVNLVIPILFLTSCLFLVLFPIPLQPWNTIIGLSIVLLGIPVYYLCIKRQKKRGSFHYGLTKFTEFIQSLLQVAWPDTEAKLLSSTS